MRGALRSAQIGYWVDEGHANRGITTTAVALATDHCFGPVGLHRVEVDIRPGERAQPPRRREARLPRRGPYVRYLDIDGGWRDHVTYALTVEDVPERACSAGCASAPPDRADRGNPNSQPDVDTPARLPDRRSRSG